MDHDHHPVRPQTSPASGAKWARWKVEGIMFVVIIGLYLLREHWRPLLGVAPYLLLLACPLMHVFMHHGHAGHVGRNSQHGRDQAGSDGSARRQVP